MLVVKRKPRETTKSLLRRFSSLVLRSGVLIETKKRISYQPSLSEKEKREKVLRKLKKEKESGDEIASR